VTALAIAPEDACLCDEGLLAEHQVDETVLAQQILHTVVLAGPR